MSVHHLCVILHAFVYICLCLYLPLSISAFVYVCASPMRDFACLCLYLCITYACLCLYLCITYACLCLYLCITYACLCLYLAHHTQRPWVDFVVRQFPDSVLFEDRLKTAAAIKPLFTATDDGPEAEQNSDDALKSLLVCVTTLRAGWSAIRDHCPTLYLFAALALLLPLAQATHTPKAVTYRAPIMNLQ